MTDPRAPHDRTRLGVVVAVLATALLCAGLLALPGQTVATVYVNDLMIFLDGAHRVAAGQVPHRDFHAALGPLVYYLPAAGFWLTGSLGAAMPVGMALLIAAFVPILAFVVAGRLRPVLALPFAVFLILILAVPLNLGESVSALTFAMFYNRIGWAALASLVVMVLPPERRVPGQSAFDALAAALLVLLMLYAKISYGVVGLAFLVFMLLDPLQRGWAAMALAITLAAGLVVELLWGGSAAHLADLSLAAKVSGGVRGGLEEVAHTVLRNLADYVLFAFVTALALWRTRSLRDLLFYGFCAGAGLMIVIQNSQGWGVVTLHAGVAVALERLLRSSPRAAGERPSAVPAGAPFLLLVFVLPGIVHFALALGLHAALASTRPIARFALPNFERIKIADLRPLSDHDFAQRYGASLADGARALARLGPAPGPVFVLDFVNPFSAGLGLAPPRGDHSWQHWGRNVDARHFIPPDELLRDVRVVMEPKWGINARPLQALYGAYVAEHYALTEETADWKVHVRRESPAAGLGTAPRRS